MRLLVLGASGRTGQHLLSQALAQDHHVTGLVRTPSKIDEKHERLTVESCDVFDREQLQPHVNECDIVISCLGYPLQYESPVLHFETVETNVCECMKVAGKRRAIFMHSWYTSSQSRADKKIPVFILTALEGMEKSEEMLKGRRDHLDYTCVLPGGLNNDPVTDKEFVINDTDFCVPEVERRTMTARADVARYILTILEDTTSYGKCRAICPVDKTPSE